MGVRVRTVQMFGGYGLIHLRSQDSKLASVAIVSIVS